MKKLLLAFGFCLVIFQGSAAQFEVTGEIGVIRYHEINSTIAPHWVGVTWFTLISRDEELGECKKWNGDPLIAIPEGNINAISIMLAAKMASQKVLITVDDEGLYPSSHCKLEFITLL